MNKKINLNFRNLILITLLSILSVYTLPSWLSLNNKNSVIIISLFFILFISIFVSSNEAKWKSYDIINMILLLVLIILGLATHDLIVVFIAIMSIGMYFYDFNTIFYIYGINQLIILCMYILLTLLKIVPSFDEQGYFVLGFTNKNVLGFVLMNVFVFLININITAKITKIIRVLILLVLFFIVYQYTSDRTVALLMLVTFVLHWISKTKNGVSRSVKLLIVSLPIILTVLSIFLAKNYARYTWIQHLDIFLSSRIKIWSEYWNTFNISWFPQNINIFNYNFTPGEPLLIREAMDGFFALGLLQHGIIIFSIFIILLMVALYYSSKHYNSILLISLIVYTIMCFSEYSPLTYYSSSFLFPFVLSELGRENRERDELISY